MHLQFADGSAFALVTGNIAAEAIIAQLSTIMQLEAGSDPARSLVIITSDTLVDDRSQQASIAIPLPMLGTNDHSDPLVCRLLGIEKETGAFLPQKSATKMVHDVLGPEGMLLHGALAEGPCGGIILAGSGGIGKSTASDRLSSPWRSLSDDTTLVVRDAQGQYWAHPWPTWSRFHNNGSGGSWDVQYAVPLRGIFFLKQAPDDRAIAIPTQQVTNSLIEAAQQARYLMTDTSPEVIARIMLQELNAAMALAAAVPAHTLNISLTGTFWEEIERVLPVDHTPAKHMAQPNPVAAPAPTVTNSDPQPDNTVKHAVTIGSGMAPTLCEPDVLTIEPYREQPVRRGDVVCFQLPESDELVQRVVRIDAQSIHTRSDHPEHTERYCLQTPHIVGRVVAAQRGQQQRKIAGGWRGHMTAYVLHLQHAHSGFWNRVYDTLAPMKLFQHIVPPRLKPRVLLFTQGLRQQYKIMIGARIVGYTDAYYARQNLSRPQTIEWHIQPPFRLFIDEDQLPRFPPSESSV